VELNSQKMEDFKGRYKYFLIVLGAAFLLIAARLWHLQVIKGSDLRRLSENNRIRLRETPADRGMLLDREGRVLADNRPSFEVLLVPEDIRENPEVLVSVGEILKMPLKEIQDKLQAPRHRPPFGPVKIKSDMDWKELALLESNRVHLPGVFVDVRSRRTYRYGPLASHLIGHIGEIDESELRRSNGASYRMGAIVGKSGVEVQWEAELRGVDGGRQVEVDALGREIKTLRRVEPLPGNNLYLTIDLDLQKAAEEAFQNNNGALMAMDPRTGRILAMVSKPAFDPRDFAGNFSHEDWNALVNHPDHPLQNRNIQGQYPPGSVFKIITAIAGLESGVITPTTPLVCTGTYPYGNRDFRCWKEEGHGTLTLHRAIVESCDIYFYQVGLKVGVDRIAKYAHEFGLGRKTGIAYPQEKPGTVPSTSWKRRHLGTPWYSGETLSLAVGQGYITTTPLQLLLLTSAIANGGKLHIPQIVERIEDIHGIPIMEFPPLEVGDVNVSPATMQFIREALKGAVNEPHATGWACALQGITVAGKTGTAQVIRLPKDFKRGDMDQMPLKLRDHAWFIAFAPFEAPRIAIVILVEHGGFGGAAAAPIAKKVIEKYLTMEPPPKMAGHVELPAGASR
jgi:penicillin-binding protein 2